MDTPRKNNDCYFYYYSTCLKGDGCMFRHEASALGCETVCSFWQQGKCLNQHCNYRHMELRKNRKMIPCYWETQPGGCRKPHCSFHHKNPREPPTVADMEKAKECEGVGAGKPLERSDWPRRTVMAEGGQYEECVGSSDSDSGRVGPRRVSQSSETSYGSPPVDPLVVNFEEESDNESVPTSTPTKKQPQKKNVHVKTLEEIRLERIQAESAAFYAYNNTPIEPVPDTTVALSSSWDGSTDNDLRSRILSRKSYRNPQSNIDFRVMTLDEIRKNRQLDDDMYSNTDEMTSVTVSCSRDITDDDMTGKQFGSQFDIENNNGTSQMRFQFTQKTPVSDIHLEEDEVCSDEGTVLFARKVGSEKNGLAQIQVRLKDNQEDFRTTEKLLHNSESNITIKTLAQIRAEKYTLNENSSSCPPKKRSYSPIVFDNAQQKHFCRNTESENEDVSMQEESHTADESKKRKPVIVRKHSISNPEQIESSCPPKRLRRFIKKTESSQTKSDGEDTPKSRPLRLRRNAPASENLRVVRLSSDSLANSEVTVEVNGMFSLKTEGPIFDRLGQPLLKISDVICKSDSVSLTSSFVCDESSNAPCYTVGRNVPHNSSHITLNPSTSILSQNQPAENNVVTEVSSESLNKLTLSSDDMDILDAGEESGVVQHLSTSAEQDGMDTDDDLLLDNIEDNLVTLDAEEDILQDIDALLND